MNTETSTCRECGATIEYEPHDSELIRQVEAKLGYKVFPQICRECGDKMAAGERAALREALRQERNVPVRYAGATFETFTPRTPTQRQALETARDHARDGIYLSGRPGCGKTHLACAAVMAGPEGSLFVSTTDLLDDIRAGFDGGGEGLYERAKHAPLLALDDLGSESVTDWVRDRLYVLLNTRWNSGAPMIVTTNCTPPVIKERIGAAGLSRLAMCRHRIEITGPDGRRALQVTS